MIQGDRIYLLKCILWYDCPGFALRLTRYLGDVVKELSCQIRHIVKRLNTRYILPTCGSDRTNPAIQINLHFVLLSYLSCLMVRLPWDPGEGNNESSIKGGFVT
jgi:hypothetical protein